MGFRTRQIHAGVTPDPDDRRHPDADSPVDDVRAAVGRRVPEQGLHLLALRQPDGQVLEAKLAELEGGVDCACFGTGMGAIHGRHAGLPERNGSHAIISDVAYGGTYRLATKVMTKFGVEFTFANAARPG